jgi:hypothetical protein
MPRDPACVERWCPRRDRSKTPVSSNESATVRFAAKISLQIFSLVFWLSALKFELSASRKFL